MLYLQYIVHSIDVANIVMISFFGWVRSNLIKLKRLRSWGGVLRKKSMGSTLAGSLHDAVKLLLEISGPESPLLKMIDWRSWIISRLRALWKRSRKPLVASRLEKEVIGLSAFVSTAVDGICCIHTSFWDRFHRWNTVVIGTGVREKGTPSS